MATNRLPPGDSRDADRIAEFVLRDKRRERICYNFCHGVPIEFMDCPNCNGVSKPLLELLVQARFFVNELLDYASEHYDKRQEAEDFLEELALIEPFAR